MRIAFIVILFVLGPLLHGNAQEESPFTDITTSDLKAKGIIVDLSNPESMDLALKKIHQFKNLEFITLEGETDEATLKKLFYRLSALKGLTKIKFSNNDIKKIPESLTVIKSLKSVVVEGNPDLDYSNLFSSLSKISITELELIGNELKNCPKNISDLKSLTKLKITDNNLLDYVQLVDNLAETPIKELSIPFNFITEIPKNITKLKSLTLLDVSENSLSEVPNDASALKAINNLSIQGNVIVNQVKELEKFKGTDLRALSLDNELTGDEVEQIKKMFPNVELNFPLTEKEEEEKTPEANNTPKELVDSKKEKEQSSGSLSLKKELTILSIAYLSYPALFKGIVYNFDTLTFKERYLSLNYSNVFRLWTGERSSGSFSFIREMHIRLRKKDRGLRFYFPTYNQMNVNYPELKSFSGMYWIYTGELSKRKFKKTILKHAWNDIRLELSENNSMFTMTLKDREGFRKIDVQAIFFNNNTSIEKSIESYSKKIVSYQKALNRKEKTYDRNLKREKKKTSDQFNKLNEYAWKELQTRMSNEEKIMSKEEWMKYYEQIVADEKAIIDNSPLRIDLLERSLVVRGFNLQSNISKVDNTQVITYGKSILLNASFYSDGNKLAVKNYYIIDGPQKTSARKVGNMGISDEIIDIRQNAGQFIIVELLNGFMGIVDVQEINKCNPKASRVDINVKLFDKNLTTIGELLSAGGIK